MLYLSLHMWRRILICRFIYRFSMDCTFPSLSKFAPLVIIYSKRPASENLHLFPFFSILSSNNMNDRMFCRVLEPPQIIDSNQMIVGPSSALLRSDGTHAKLGKIFRSRHHCYARSIRHDLECALPLSL